MQLTSDRGRLDSVLTLTMATFAALTVFPVRAQGCPVIVPSASETIAIELAPGKTAMLEIDLYDEGTDDASCSAWIEIPLSTFPTSRLATRPADIAPSMRDVVAKLGAKECDVFVQYVNDTEEELADHELCINESFEFGARKHWSLAREEYCWEPDPNELQVVEID